MLSVRVCGQPFHSMPYSTQRLGTQGIFAPCLPPTEVTWRSEGRCRCPPRKLLTAENKKCLVHSQQLAFVFVVDESQFPKPVHKEANSRSRCPHHFSQYL